MFSYNFYRVYFYILLYFYRVYAQKIVMLIKSNHLSFKSKEQKWKSFFSDRDLLKLWSLWTGLGFWHFPPNLFPLSFVTRNNQIKVYDYTRKIKQSHDTSIWTKLSKMEYRRHANVLRQISSLKPLVSSLTLNLSSHSACRARFAASLVWSLHCLI